MCHCHSKIQSDTQLWWDWISSVFHNFLSKALSCLLQFSPLYQVESSLCLLICSLVCQAFSTSNNKHAENCSNYLYQVPILSAIQGWFQVSHEDFWFLWHARNGLSYPCLSHRFISLNALFSCLLVTSLLFLSDFKGINYTKVSSLNSLETDMALGTSLKWALNTSLCPMTWKVPIWYLVYQLNKHVSCIWCFLKTKEYT